MYDLNNAYTKKNLIPVAIIGSGPAGLSAALYTARAKIKTIIFAGHEPGGQLNHVRRIENWPGKEKIEGAVLMKELDEQAQHFGAEMIYETIKRVDFTEWPFKLISNSGKEIHALAVIIATGGLPKKLEIPGVDEYWGKGIGTCAICDAPFNKDQDVIVVGGSDAAAEVALQLAAYAKKVTVISEEKQLAACATVQDYLKDAKNIEILTDLHPEKVIGDGTSVTGLDVKNTKGEVYIIPTKALYFVIGYKPISNIFKPYIETDENGFVIMQGRSQKTSIPGIFAAGTIEDKVYGKAGIASGNGIKAALDALAFLESIGLTPYAAKKMVAQFYVARERKTSDIKQINSEPQLKKLVTEAKKPVIIDLFAPYCPSCIHLMPEVEALAAELHNRIEFAKIDVSKSPALAKLFSISAIPSFVIFKDGNEVARTNQIDSRDALKDYIATWT